MKNYSFVFLLIGILTFGQNSIINEIDSETAVNEDSISTENITPTRAERGELFHQERAFQSDFKQNYQEKKFDYNRKIQQKKASKPFQLHLPKGLMSVLMYAILAIIIILVVYYLFKNTGGFSFGKEKQKINFKSSEENQGENSDDIADNDFPNLIQKAKSEKDFRKAIRYYHLWVLQKLSDQNLINWNKDKTDYDYLIELKNHPIKEDFSISTYIFDYTWYGNSNPDSTQFELAEKIFNRTLKKLN